MLKQITFLMFAFILSFGLNAQKSEWTKLDKSPMDAAMYPSSAAWRNYLSGDDRNLTPKLKVVYSRPQKNDRQIFGSLLPYGKSWRLGANQATELIVYRAIDIAGTTIYRGTYTLSATPQVDHWMVSVHSDKNVWGVANLDEANVLATVKVPVENMPESEEALVMTFQKVDDNNVNLVIQWDKTRVSVPINLNPVTFAQMDKSPMDEAMYPVSANGQNYLKEDEKEANQPMMRIRYSRPQKKGRAIFGELLKYGEVWRVGANESTELRLYKDANIGGEMIKAGVYNLYAVVNETSWDFILNQDIPAWGAANRDESKDVAMFKVPVSKEEEVVEALTIKYEDQEDGSTHIIVAWDQHRARIPVKF